MGPRQKKTGLYFFVRIKRKKDVSRYARYVYVSLEKQAIDGRWVKLGDYDTEDKALEALEDEVETMKLISSQITNDEN